MYLSAPNISLDHCNPNSDQYLDNWNTYYQNGLWNHQYSQKNSPHQREVSY